MIRTKGIELIPQNQKKNMTANQKGGSNNDDSDPEIKKILNEAKHEEIIIFENKNNVNTKSEDT